MLKIGEIMGDEEGMWGLPMLSAQFFCKPKTSLKLKLVIKEFNINPIL